MIRRILMPLALCFLTLLAERGASQETPAQEGNPAAESDSGSKEDLKALQDRGLKGDGPDLLDYFRKHTFKQPDPKQIAALVKQLGDDDFDTREKAFVSLMEMGASALAGIKQGESDSDLEVRKRAGDLKQRVESKTEPLLQAAAVRQLARVKPAGTVDVLLAFLPFATDALVIDETATTLGAVALRGGKIEPALIKALGDPIAVKRGVAGEALLRSRVKDQVAGVKKLLKDPDASVRFRIAVAMIPLGDKDILPVMVDLMTELPESQLWPIEEAFSRLAGEKAPNVSFGSDDVSRKKCRDAWRQWLTDNAKTIDMTKLVQGDTYLGYTLVVQQNNFIGPGRGTTGEIFELDANKKIRWKFDVPTYPVDGQMVGGTRVLIAEYQGGRVTERDLKGDIKWEYNCGGNPFAVQRLPNGNTFVAMRGRLVEVDRLKNVVWSYQRPQDDIVRARRLPTGEVAFITNAGINALYNRMEPKSQKFTKQFNISPVTMMFGNFDVLANGHVIVPHFNHGRVVEYDDAGGQVATINYASPNSAVRLPNGDTLIASQNSRQINVYNRDRTPVWSYTSNGSVFVARRR